MTIMRDAICACKSRKEGFALVLPILRMTVLLEPSRFDEQAAEEIENVISCYLATGVRPRRRLMKLASNGHYGLRSLAAAMLSTYWRVRLRSFVNSCNQGIVDNAADKIMVAKILMRDIVTKKDGKWLKSEMKQIVAQLSRKRR